MEQPQSKYPDTFYRVSLKAVIRNDKGEVLVNKEYEIPTYSLPGGGWEHGEPFEAALARELKEEVNYEGAFTHVIRGTERFWLPSREAWLLWIIVDVTPEHYNFSPGVDSTDVAFVSPKSLDGGSIQEQWIADNL